MLVKKTKITSHSRVPRGFCTSHVTFKRHIKTSHTVKEVAIRRALPTI